MFSFQDGLATNLTFRLTPNAGLIWPNEEVPFDALMARSLPSQDVTKDTLTNAYVQFILYCNPQFPADVDASQLRDRFNNLPRSDNKEFEAWILYELITAFNSKKIDTWGQLALELGVEPPDTTKGQSVQKVQQYTVRLKRWMRALHIDAFFDYLNGRQHAYYTDIPPVDAPYPPDGRDGVPTEEDLAIRALEPALRPKRGRRRNSEIEQEEAAAGTRQFLDPQSAYPQSAIPGSAVPNSALPMNDPWTATSAINAQQFAPWQAHSAITPSTSAMRWARPGGSEQLGTPIDLDTEPRSAILPSNKKRRKHGPAVSSAWSASTPSGSKPRGRPPAKQAQEGPFSTFPVQGDFDQSTSAIAPGRSLDNSIEGMPPPRSAVPTSAGGRPTRLSLTVPQHAGGPVRLATPPRLIVGGESSDRGSVSQTPEPSMFPSYNRPMTTSSVASDAGVFTFEMLKRTLASDLLRADVVGRPQRLNGDEAKRLADIMLERMNVPRLEVPDLRACVARLTTASWLGLGDQLNIPSGPAAGSTKKIRVTRFRNDADGYEEVVPADEESQSEIRSVFDVRWQAAQGMCQGKFEMSGLVLAPGSTSDDNIHDLILHKVVAEARALGLSDELGDLESRAKRSYIRYLPDTQRNNNVVVGDDDKAVDWKSKYRMMEFATAMAHGEFDRYRQIMLQKVLEVFL